MSDQLDGTETPPASEIVATVNARKLRGITKLYRGLTAIDFVGRRKLWFLLSAIVIVAGALSLGVRGLNLGIDFKGGDSWQFSAKTVSQTEALNAVEAVGLKQPTVFILVARLTGTRTITVQADLKSLSSDQQATMKQAVSVALAKLVHTSPNNISTTHIGPTWGGQVTQRALYALLAFFVAVIVYISARFEPKMAIAAFLAMVHDLLVTLGVYSLFGFQITPDTVVAILTILGYSLYDTVVVFDRVRDNSRSILNGGTLTYSDMVNLSMNQTLARSINTSLVAIFPVLSVLLVGAQLLGATTLQNYGVALFVGLMSGAYSSIFIASPLLAILKEREPRFRELRQRVSQRVERITLTPAAAAAMGGERANISRSRQVRSTLVTGAVTPKARKQKRR